MDEQAPPPDPQRADFLRHEPLLSGAYEAFREGTRSGYRMSLIEACKILDGILLQKGFPGRTPIQRIESARLDIPNYEKILRNFNKRTEVVESLDYELTVDLVQEALDDIAYAVTSLTKVPANSFIKRIQLRLRRFYKKTGPNKIFGFFFGFVIFVIFLSKTSIGLLLVEKFLKFIDSLVTGIFILAAFGLVLLTSFAFLEKKKR